MTHLSYDNAAASALPYDFTADSKVYAHAALSVKGKALLREMTDVDLSGIEDPAVLYAAEGLVTKAHGLALFPSAGNKEVFLETYRNCLRLNGNLRFPSASLGALLEASGTLLELHFDTTT